MADRTSVDRRKRCPRYAQRAGALTAMDAQVLLQVMLVFKCFAAFGAFEFAVASRRPDVSLSEREIVSFHRLHIPFPMSLINQV